MDFGVRDWMILVGILLILAVLLDGYRRVRNERRGNIRMSLNKQFLNSQEDDPLFGSELPSGGPRVIDPRPKPEPTVAEVDSELDLDQSVPMLMESVAEMSAEIARSQQQADRDIVDDFGPADDGDDLVVADPLMDAPIDEQAEAPDPLLDDYTPTEQVDAVTDRADTVPADQHEVIVVNVMAKDEAGFKGNDLLHILLACDLRFGKMNIFHRYEHSSGRGAVQFSVANVVEPGVFDLDNIDGFSTPGVCFFLNMPGPEDCMQAFDFMVETAQCLVKNLDGELLDEMRSVMTVQTLDHCRQRIRDFERRQLALHV